MKSFLGQWCIEFKTLTYSKVLKVMRDILAYKINRTLDIHLYYLQTEFSQRPQNHHPQQNQCKRRMQLLIYSQIMATLAWVPGKGANNMDTLSLRLWKPEFGCLCPGLPWRRRASFAGSIYTVWLLSGDRTPQGAPVEAVFAKVV